MPELVNASYRNAAEAASLRPLLVSALAGAGVEDDCIDVAILLLSELASNALHHTDTAEPLVRVDQMGSCVRVAVTDAGAGLPTMRAPAPDRVGGNGLRIVDSLATAWGTEVHDGLGKTVWFTIPA